MTDSLHISTHVSPFPIVYFPEIVMIRGNSSKILDSSPIHKECSTSAVNNGVFFEASYKKKLLAQVTSASAKAEAAYRRHRSARQHP